MSLLSRLPWHWLPPLLTAVLILYWHIDVPYHDQWDLLPVLQAKIAGTLRWQQLWQPHNGHILLLPRAIMLALATLTHWNTLAEVLFSFCCMLTCWRLLHYFTAVLLARPLEKIEQFCLALLVFSWAQAQNWLWGWQLQVPLALLCSLCGFVSILLLRNPVSAFVTAILFGLAASASFAGSLPYWLAATPLLWQRRKSLLLPWFAVCAGCAWLYLLLLNAGNSAAAPAVTLTALPSLFGNSLLALGNLAGRYHTLAALFSAIAALAAVATNLHSRTTAQRMLMLSLLLFSGGSALLIAATRGGMGSEQMLASRYGTLMLPLLIAAFAALRSNSGKWSKMLATLLMVSCVASSLYSLKEFRQLHNRLHNGALALAALQKNPADESARRKLLAINPRANQQQALAEVALLQQYGFSFYRDKTPAKQAPP